MSFPFRNQTTHLYPESKLVISVLPVCLGICPAGSHGDDGLAPCSTCPLNYYQDEDGGSVCKPCADTEITETEGSINRSDCFGMY